MQFYRQHKRFIKISGLVAAFCGTSWFSYQVWEAHDLLENALDVSIVNYMEPATKKVYEAREDVVVKWLRTHHPSVFSLTRIWNSLRFSYAVRLLHLTGSKHKTVRTKAVKNLGQIKELDDWHYSLLAHMCDSRTAVGLARTKDVDLRFFLDPPFRYMTYNHQMFINTMKEFLISLHNKSKHHCLGYFISRAFVDVQDVGRMVDQDHPAVELTKFIQSADDVLTMCLEPILHHSAVEDYARDIVQLNGLPILMEIHNRFRNNIDVNVTLCRILSNICTYPEHLEELFKSGWIGVLAGWLQNSDVRISCSAAKSLANLDSDVNCDCTYPRRVYVLHPIVRTDVQSEVDVVFVHGLLGDVFYTWRQRAENEDSTLGLFESLSTIDTCVPKKLLKSSDPNVQEYIKGVQDQKKIEWEQIGKDFEFVWSDIPIKTNTEAKGPYTCPGSCYCLKSGSEECEAYTQCWPRDWLPEDCKFLRVIGLNYDTSLSMWAPLCPSEHMKTNLEERSNEFLSKLVKAGLGRKPIVWVTHSMGGLIVKKIINKAFESNDKELKDISLKTRGVVFYSTPHFGSRIARINQAVALVLWPSVEVQELREKSPHLVHLNNRFLDIVQQLGIQVVSFVETKSTLVTAMKFNFLFVEPHSANPGVGEYYEIPQDHLSICKPLSRHSFLYQKILHLIQDTVEQKQFNW